MHPATLALLLAAIRAELQGDPTSRGYKGKTTAEIVELLNAPLVTQPPVVYRPVPISDVRGFLEARLVMVRLEDWVQTADHGLARDAARTLLRITSDTGLTNFRTDTESGRANILGLFAALVQTGAGGLTTDHYAEIAAMTVAPAGPATVSASRWSFVIEGKGGVVEEVEGGRNEWPGPPNIADEALIAEALA